MPQVAAALSDGTEVVCECCLLGTALLVMVLVGACMLDDAVPCIRQLCVALQNGIWHMPMSPCDQAADMLFIHSSMHACCDGCAG